MLSVLLIGNISAGKSFLAKQIGEEFDMLKTVSIDRCRRDFSDGSFSGEYQAWSVFFSELESSFDNIVEFSGGGAHKYAVRQVLLERKNLSNLVLVVYISTSLKVCVERSRDRQWDVPYPWTMSPTEEILQEIEKNLLKDWNAGFWESFVCLKSDSQDKIIEFLRRELNGEANNSDGET